MTFSSKFLLINPTWKKHPLGKVKEPEAACVVDRRGRKKAVILYVEQYERAMEDLADLSAIAARKNERTVPWEEAKRRIHSPS